MSTVHNNIMGYRSVLVTAIMAPGSALRILSAPPGTIGTVGSPASCKVQTCAPALGKPAPGDTSRCHLPASGRCGRLQPVRPVAACCGNLGDGNMTAMGLNGGLACSSACNSTPTLRESREPRADGKLDTRAGAQHRRE